MYACVLVEQNMVKTPPLHLPGNVVPTLDAMCDKVCQLGSRPSYCRENLGTGEVL